MRSRCFDCDFYEPPVFITDHCQLYTDTEEVCKQPQKNCATCPQHTESVPTKKKEADPSEVRHAYYELNKEMEKARNKKWVEDNRKQRREYMRRYMKLRRKADDNS